MPALGEKPFPAVFIRAPLILGTGPEVEILARLADGTIVAARQDTNLAIAFHPELGSDLRLHGYFLEIVASYQLTGRDGIQSEAKKINRKAAIPAD
jgi:5'-phosphate synthase pdxT subunit